MTKAQAFVSGKMKTSTAGPRRVQLAHKQLTQAQTTNDALYYVFNIGEKNGFVIVSGDDRTPAVLGYCDNGAFNPDNMPENMRAWLQGYADQLAWLQAHPEAEIADEPTPQQTSDVMKFPAKAPAKNAIQPLLQVEWGQGPPYNNNCPPFFGYESVTGCVATAMAQVMSYHQHPAATTKEIPSYEYATEYSGGPLISDPVPVTAFDWEHQMCSFYSTVSTTDQQTFIASLMRCCGASVEMQYANSANGGSGANDGMVPDALIDYFDYSPATHLESRNNYSLTEWNNLIYSELAANRPVFYGGRSSGGGHAFVIDGYDGDELFHVNWGWNGESNGYFLLSVLNPNNTTGIGASTSNDGYSYGQDAVIGIEPNCGQTPIATPQYLTFTFPTYNSSSSELIFAPGIQNNSGRDGAFDMSLAVIDNEGNIIGVRSYYTNISFSSTSFIDGYLPFDLDNFSHLLSNGTNKMVPVSRITGTSEWYTSFHVPYEYISVEVNSGVITASYFSADVLTIDDVSCYTNHKANNVQKLDVTVSNAGEEYYGNIYLFASKTSDMGTAKNNVGVTIQKNKSLTTSLEFTPTEDGTYNLWFTKDEEGNYLIYATTIDIVAGASTTNNVVDLTFNHDIINASGDILVGKDMQVMMTITNPSTTTNYYGAIEFDLFKWVGVDGSRIGADVVQDVSVPAGESIVLDYTFSDLEVGGKYSLRTFYYYNNGWKTTDATLVYDRYVVSPVISVYDMDGNRTDVAASSAPYQIPPGTTAIDLRGNTTTTEVEWGSGAENPNALFFISDGAMPPTFTNGDPVGNVVESGVAANITLVDGYDFRSPFDFQANNISYTRTFSSGETLSRMPAGTIGWTTMTLPFDVKSVTVDLTRDDPSYPAAYPLDWFHSDTDTGKNFWVMEFSSETGTTVNFDHADKIKSGKPYLIGIPGSDWGIDNDLTDYDISFHGQNVIISGDFRSAVSGDNFKMKGSLVGKVTLPEDYVMNANGSAFEKDPLGSTVNPFRAYFEATSTANLAKSLTIGFGDDDETETTSLGGISVNKPTTKTDGIYDISGRKVANGQLPKGVYIVNGKKVVIK